MGREAEAIRRLVLASNNPDKAAEIVAVMREALPAVEIVPRPSALPEVEEDGATLLDNARLKAAAVAGATGQPGLADDTGLEVASLGGAPGVRSARFAGEGATYSANVARLLDELADATDRRARFRTIALVRWPDGREVSAEGVVEGSITRAPRGHRGFGYDPVFVPSEGDGRTFAELEASEKDALSHRGLALRALAAELTRLASP